MDAAVSDSRVVTHLKRYLDEMLLVLPSHVILPPTLSVDGPYGLKRVELAPASEPDATDRRLKSIPTTAVIAESEEAAVMMFSARSFVETCDGDPGPGAEETYGVTILHWSEDGMYAHNAPLIRRRNQPPVVGAWTHGPTLVFGPISTGVSAGIDMVSRLRLPENRDLRFRIDSLRKAFSDENVIDAVYTTLCEVGWLPLDYTDDDEDF